MTTDDNPPEDASIINESPVAVAEPVEAEPEVEVLSAEDLDALYDEDGQSRFVNDQGEPVDGEGNPIPATRPTAIQAEEVEPEVEASPAPARSINQRSPMTTLLDDNDRTRAESLADPEVWELFEKMARNAAAQEAIAREEEREAVSELGVASQYQRQARSAMARVQSAVPQELRGTKRGNEIALALAAVQEAGDERSFLDVLTEWRADPQVAPSAEQQKPSVPVQQKKQTPYMAPSARTTVPRSAPESVRTNRPAKEIGGLSEAELAIMRRERNTIKNGR